MTQPPPPTIEDVEAYYDRMDQFYKIVWGESLHGGYWPDPAVDLSLAESQEELTKLMIQKTGLQQGDWLVDVGCGTGVPGIRAAQATGCHVRGITVAHSQVAQANQRAAAEQISDLVQFQWGNAMKMPFDAAAFDAAWAFESIFHMPDRLHVLGEIARVLRPQGTLVLTDIVETQPISAAHRAIWYPSFQINSITTLENYAALFDQAGFAQIECFDLTQDIARTLEKTKQAIEEKRAELVSVYGAEMFTMLDQVWDVTDTVYSNHINYVLLVVRKV